MHINEVERILRDSICGQENRYEIKRYYDHICCESDFVLLRDGLEYAYFKFDETRKTDEVVIKVMHLYDGLMLQKNENYRENVEFLDSLAAQHKGTPVSKMMKFLRWNAGRFINPNPRAIRISRFLR